MGCLEHSTLWLSLQIAVWKTRLLCMNTYLTKTWCSSSPDTEIPLSTLCIKWLASKLCCAVSYEHLCFCVITVCMKRQNMGTFVFTFPRISCETASTQTNKAHSYKKKQQHTFNHYISHWKISLRSFTQDSCITWFKSKNKNTLEIHKNRYCIIFYLF